MQLGIYDLSVSDPDDITYIRTALYDFETDNWSDTSSGYVVSQASPEPSPEELKVRFDMLKHNKIVATPEFMEDNGHDVDVATPDFDVEDGHQRRQERGGAPMTQMEDQHRKENNILVIPDAADPDKYTDTDRTLVTESDYDGFDYSKQFDFNFYTGEDTPDE